MHLGKWKLFSLDGCVPETGDKSALSTSGQWIKWLEKVWAKLNDSQRSIEEVLHGLTGAPITKIDLKLQKDGS